ncbi:YidH family protein [Nocardia sp. NPDC101769]|uniref:YidH family protein n=1 Tax=Nocardia sp. NPDC101769 TaxID=3364333 RepID=UPI003809DD6C
MPGERVVDYRFTLAAERTFLAWIRTSLALIAGGVAVHELVHTFATPLVRTVVATVVIGLAAVVAAGAYVRWRSIDDAIRGDRALPDSSLMVVLTAVIATICVLAGVAVAIA